MGNICLALSPAAVADLGLFSAASTLAARLWMPAEAMQVTMLPRASRDPLNQSRVIAQCVRVCLLCTAALVLFVAVLARPIIAVLLSPRFVPVVVPFLILLPGVLVRVVPKILPAYFNGLGRPGIMSAAIGAAVVTTVLLVIVLLPIWGLEGVAFAMTGGYVVEAALMVAAFARLSGVAVRTLLIPTGDDFRVLKATVRRMVTTRPAAAHQPRPGRT
jgi:O-antigen/teichoic acid export membrane protein